MVVRRVATVWLSVQGCSDAQCVSGGSWSCDGVGSTSRGVAAKKNWLATLNSKNLGEKTLRRPMRDVEMGKAFSVIKIQFYVVTTLLIMFSILSIRE
ncbi:hypothetical protein GE061_007773 [Apolygus lucorum]|uniref:Uncharacterized protein n=1 Tax=Apolygus lucorum TaxID=248454 RepID=A0A8S9WPG5_APOLU|nr:hypothetical protein GE061_007773 [Apolygus lucorum]